LITSIADGVFNTINLFETVVPALDGGQPKQEFSL
jgi:protein-L-isoaspartate(D-aspartate) O-methyltransferase